MPGIVKMASRITGKPQQQLSSTSEDLFRKNVTKSLVTPLIHHIGNLDSCHQEVVIGIPGQMTFTRGLKCYLGP
uniref:Uncharacterized protein n=1 Tax=Anguilla anguilla TaxID=7936 RepID=A0A0E9RDI4_ANGAN